MIEKVGPYLVGAIIIIGFSLRAEYRSRSLDTFGVAKVVSSHFGRKAKIRYEFLSGNKTYRGTKETYVGMNDVVADSILIVYDSSNPSNHTFVLMPYQPTKELVDSLNSNSHPSEFVSWYDY
jgi:hypothetical protein